MKKIFGVVAVARMGLTGCVLPCDDLADAVEVAQERVKPCAAEGVEFEAFNVNQCENNLDNCTDSEKEALADYADCYRKLPECTPANRQGFINAASACELSVSGKVGANCAKIFGQ